LRKAAVGQGLAQPFGCFLAPWLACADGAVGEDVLWVSLLGPVQEKVPV
jgi:hypothetical protein